MEVEWERRSGRRKNTFWAFAPSLSSDPSLQREREKEEKKKRLEGGQSK